MKIRVNNLDVTTNASKKVVVTSNNITPPSPIASKNNSRLNHLSKPNLETRSSTNEVFSPAPWRQESRDEPSRSPSKSELQETNLPRGDPLGVMFKTLENEPEVLLMMNDCPRSVPKEFRKRKPMLKAKARNMPKNTLVLDLDETLVHCTTDQSEVVGKVDACFVVTFGGVDYSVFLKKRPYLDLFLDQVSKWFEVVLFTASQKCYADKAMEIVDPDSKRVHFRLFRESCANYHGNFLKPLGILNRKPESCFIIDNSPQVFAFELNNGIPCTSWFDDQRDNELLRLLPYLKELKNCDDVRPYIRKMFGVEEFLSHL